MADLESTTSEPGDVSSISDPNVSLAMSHSKRFLTVAGCATASNVIAHIRVMGRWVEDAGFMIGTRVSVEVSDGRLVITALPEPPEYEGQTSRRLQRLAESERRMLNKRQMPAITEELFSGNYGARAW